MIRKLVTIRRVENVFPIEGADAIECIQIEGWKLVAKKGEFKQYDLALYFEIDSWLPASDQRFAFLMKDKREFNGVPGARLKTIRLRGQISQGLAMPLSQFQDVWSTAMVGLQRHLGNDIKFDNTKVAITRNWYAFIRELDFTPMLGVQKWEPPVDPKLSGVSKGGFPYNIPKTDQERVQNLPKLFTDEKYGNLQFEITVKLDGSSMTAYLDEGGVLNVCSRNLNLRESDSNAFWVVARQMHIEDKLKQRMARGDEHRYAIQGELIGPGIQGNPEQLDKHQFFCYDVWDITDQRYLTPKERWEFLQDVDIPMVPVVADNQEFSYFKDVDSVLHHAEGPSLNKKVLREGIVFKCTTFDFSFKAIANSYLLKHKDR